MRSILSCTHRARAVRCPFHLLLPWQAHGASRWGEGTSHESEVSNQSDTHKRPQKMAKSRSTSQTGTGRRQTDDRETPEITIFPHPFAHRHSVCPKHPKKHGPTRAPSSDKPVATRHADTTNIAPPKPRCEKEDRELYLNRSGTRKQEADNPAETFA